MKKKKEKLNLNKQKHTISILFSTYTDFASRIVSLISGFSYTHVSIALENENEYFYAFNTKGFRKEYPKKHKNRTKNNIKYILEVTHKQYKKILKFIKEFEENKEKYKYNWLGLFSCMVKIPIKTKHHYFCSQFIAKLLEKAEIIKLKRKPGQYLPNHLNKEIQNCPLIVNRIENCFSS